MERSPGRSVAAIVPMLLLTVVSVAFAAQQGGAPGGGVVGGVVGGLPDPPSPPPPLPPAAPLRVGGNIKQPTKTKNVPPVYPPIAQSARIQGVVILEAIIGRTGRVDEAHVLRSIPLLDQAALEAVKQWEFTPTYVDGVALPVIMTVTIQFTLDSDLPPLQQMTPEARPMVLAELERRRALWTSRHPAAYSLKLITVRVPPEPAEVSTVRDGKPVSGNTTVENVFERLADSVRTADLVAIAFSPTLGFPSEFQVVPSGAPGAGARVRVEVTPVAP